MQKKFLTFHLNLCILASIIFLLSLGGTAFLSCYLKNQKKKLSNLFLQKIDSTNKEIFILNNQINKLRNNKTTKSLLKDKNELSLFQLEEKNLLSQEDFNYDLEKSIDHFKKQASIKKVTLPNNVFSIFSQKNFNSKNTKKEMQVRQEQLFLIKNFFNTLLIFPKLKIHQLEFKDESDTVCSSNNKIVLLGSFFITITTREDYFKRLLNSIVNNKYLFVVSLIKISNSNPKEPLHHYTNSREVLFPILGNEDVTAKLRVDLFNILINTFKTSDWPNYKYKNSLLFVSKHYAVKNGELINPIEYLKTRFSPVPNEWIINNNLNYNNPNIIFEDTDHTGFNNLEKWQGDNPQEAPGVFPSDPNDPASHPLLWTKLRCYQKDITSETYSIYFLKLELNKKEKEFQIQPVTPLERKNRRGKVVFDQRIRHVKMGEQIEGLPYKVVNYQEQQTIYKNTSYDSSELTIEHLDTKQQIALIKKTPYHPQPRQLTSIISIKIENTIFNPPLTMNLKLGEYFSLDYILPNDGFLEKSRIIETETYQLIDVNDRELTVRKDSKDYKIPIIKTGNK